MQSITIQQKTAYIIYFVIFKQSSLHNKNHNKKVDELGSRNKNPSISLASLRNETILYVRARDKCPIIARVE